ncbi:MAG: (Fe-S)-binding protein [Burkholderiaceae bacterium]|nr:(Fe-S)-binding protein [Burkholderiaceae bacterium]
MLINLLALRENVYKCVGCGVCRGIWERDEEAMCPIFATRIGFESGMPRGMVTVAQDLLEGHVNLSRAMANAFYRCTDCGACATNCNALSRTGEHIIDVPRVARALRADLVESSLAPPAARDVFKALIATGNAFGQPPERRGDWARKSGVEQFGPGHEFLLYVGDVGSYDERGQAMARSVARLLRAAGISFGILGEREVSDGNDVKAMGELALFEHLAKTNIDAFLDAGVRKIICLDPHSYNCFTNDYPSLGGKFDVWHYTQLTKDLALRVGRRDSVDPARDATGVAPRSQTSRVAYHDPCYLGRKNGEFEAPRRSLSAAGADLVEMPRSRRNSFCCGGGSGNFYTDLLGGGVNSAARVRVREAAATGAEIIAVACPMCSKMLDDAVKSENLDGRLKVTDIAQFILAESEHEPRHAH